MSGRPRGAGLPQRAAGRGRAALRSGCRASSARRVRCRSRRSRPRRMRRANSRVRSGPAHLVCRSPPASPCGGRAQCIRRFRPHTAGSGRSRRRAGRGARTGSAAAWAHSSCACCRTCAAPSPTIRHLRRARRRSGFSVRSWPCFLLGSSTTRAYCTPVPLLSANARHLRARRLAWRFFE